MKNDILVQKSKKFAYSHEGKIVINKYTDLIKYPKSDNPVTIFMAGSPGAGKTEISESFKPEMFNYNITSSPRVIIDLDKIKIDIPGYDGSNTESVQLGASIIADQIFYTALRNSQDIIFDSTFSNLEKVKKDINLALKKKRDIGILYVYQNPLIAWKFTKIREKLEGRPIPKDYFIRSFFNAKQNVNKIKKLYTNHVKLTLIVKDFANKIAKPYINITSVDHYLKMKYNYEDLIKLIVDKP